MRPDHVDRPSLLDRAHPSPTVLEAARLDEALHAGCGVDLVQRAYGIGNWGRLVIKGVGNGR